MGPWEVWDEIYADETEDAACYCARCGSLMDESGTCAYCLFLQRSGSRERMFLASQMGGELEGAGYFDLDAAA